jgi:zona occludens toxin (predicted ATPase)
MRLIVGLVLLALAGLWFFTPVLDSTYAKHAPGIAQAHKRTANDRSAVDSQTRSRSSGNQSSRAGSQGSTPAASSASFDIGSKAIMDNFMSMINLFMGFLGTLFTFLSYRAQVGNKRRD